MLKCIAVADLRVGMYIQEFCGSWMDHPFWKSKFLLDSRKDLQRIRDCGIRELWIDTSRGLDVEAGAASTSREEAERAVEAQLMAAETPLENRWCSLENEVERAAALCARSREAVIAMFGDARMGRALEFGQAEALVEEIAASVMRHPTALVSLSRLKRADEYTYMHSVAVCALMIALARQLKLDEPLVREAGLAGMLHDIGKMAVDSDVLNKPGKLTDTEFAEVRRHPEAGSKILLAGKQVGELVVDVCLHHHEKVDGSGYPHRLSGSGISLLARMGASMAPSPPTAPTSRAGTRPNRSAGWPNGRGTSTRWCSRPSSRRSASTPPAPWCAWRAGGWRWWWNRTRSPCWRRGSRCSTPRA